MSILRFEAVPGGTADSRYIEGIELAVSNIGSEPCEMLIQFERPGGIVFYSRLSRFDGGEKQVIGIGTGYAPFMLLIVTSGHSYLTTGITAKAVSRGAPVALFTQEYFDRLH